MPIDYSHEHFASSIIQTTDAHTPIPTTGAEGYVLQIVEGHQAFAAPAGGEQVVTLLGPFRILMTTVGIAGTGGPPTTLGEGGYVSVCDLPDGCIIVNTWAEPIVSCDQPGVKIAIDIQPTDDPDRSADISTSWRSTRGDLGAADVFRNSVGDPAGRFVARAVAGAQLMVYLTSLTPPTVIGEFDVYALIATPA